jgi:hypothetical protein
MGGADLGCQLVRKLGCGSTVRENHSSRITHFATPDEVEIEPRHVDQSTKEATEQTLCDRCLRCFQRYVVEERRLNQLNEWLHAICPNAAQFGYCKVEIAEAAPLVPEA